MAVANFYDKGFLSGVSGYVNSIKYHSNDMMSAVVHSNGVTITGEARGMCTWRTMNG